MIGFLKYKKDNKKRKNEDEESTIDGALSI